MLNIDKNEEEDKRNKEVTDEEIAPELDVLLKAIIFLITKKWKTKTK